MSAFAVFFNSTNDFAGSYSAYWRNMLTITALAASTAVNALATSMIVFRILKVTRVEPTSVERTLGSTGVGNRFRHIMFIGMTLFVFQLVRVVLLCLPLPVAEEPFYNPVLNIVISINQMLNVIIIFCSFLFLLLITFTWLGHHTNDNFGSGSNEVVLQ